MRIVDVSDFRRSLAAVVDSVRDDQNPVLIVRYNRPIAAVVPIGWLPESAGKMLFATGGSDQVNVADGRGPLAFAGAAGKSRSKAFRTKLQKRPNR